MVINPIRTHLVLITECNKYYSKNEYIHNAAFILNIQSNHSIIQDLNINPYLTFKQVNSSFLSLLIMKIIHY